MAYEDLCQKIIEGAQDAIIFADQEGTIRLWNAGAEAMLVMGLRRPWGRPWI